MAAVISKHAFDDYPDSLLLPLGPLGLGPVWLLWKQVSQFSAFCYKWDEKKRELRSCNSSTFTGSTSF